jgi:hypothetical protein
MTEKPMRRALLGMTGLLLFAGACGPPVPPAPPVATVQVVPLPTASAAAKLTPPPDPAIVSVIALRPPAKLAIDGDAGEWGSLVPSAAPAPPVHDPRPTANQEEDPKGLPSGPNPRDAASHLGLALSSDAVLIAAELGEPAREGIWLGIGSLAPDLPAIGEVSRGGSTEPLKCKFEQVYVGEGSYVDGKPNPPEIVAACELLLDRHAKFVAKHEERFARAFKIDRDGVRAVQPDGTLAAIEGAKAVFKPGATGATVEVSLPLKAMPRVADAPCKALRLVARAVTTPAPPLAAQGHFAPDQWVWLALPDAISFEPYGELRARVFDPASLEGVIFMFPTTGMSYHPGDPLHLETMGYPADRHSVVASEEMLYKKLAAVGDIEIGHVAGYREGMAIFKKGKLADVLFGTVASVPPGIPQGILPRDGELHVFSYQDMSSASEYGTAPPMWSVVAIAADGSHRDDVLDQAGDVPEWEDGWVFASPDLASFGVRGSTHYPKGSKERVEKPQGFEVTWRWDKAKKKYAATMAVIPLPKKPQKK